MKDYLHGHDKSLVTGYICGSVATIAGCTYKYLAYLSCKFYPGVFLQISTLYHAVIMIHRYVYFNLVQCVMYHWHACQRNTVPYNYIPKRQHLTYEGTVYNA